MAPGDGTDSLVGGTMRQSLWNEYYLVLLSVSSKAAESSPGADFPVIGNVQARGVKGSEKTPPVPGGR